MTRDEIYELALQCRVWIPLASGPEREQTIDKLRRFVALVAAAERDDCLPALPERCLVNAVAQARNDRLRSADGGADFRVGHSRLGDLDEGGFDVHAQL